MEIKENIIIELEKVKEELEELEQKIKKEVFLAEGDDKRFFIKSGKYQSIEAANWQQVVCDLRYPAEYELPLDSPLLNYNVVRELLKVIEIEKELLLKKEKMPKEVIEKMRSEFPKNFNTWSKGYTNYNNLSDEDKKKVQEVYWSKVEKELEIFKTQFNKKFNKSDDKRRLLDFEIEKCEKIFYEEKFKTGFVLNERPFEDDYLTNSDINGIRAIYKRSIVNGQREFSVTKSEENPLNSNADRHHIRTEALWKYYGWLKILSDENFKSYIGHSTNWKEIAFQYNTGKAYQNKQDLVAVFWNSYVYYQQKFEAYYEEYKVLPVNYFNELIFAFRQNFPKDDNRVSGVNYFDDLIEQLMEKYKNGEKKSPTTVKDPIKEHGSRKRHRDRKQKLEDEFKELKTVEQKIYFLGNIAYSITFNWFHHTIDFIYDHIKPVLPDNRKHHLEQIISHVDFLSIDSEREEEEIRQNFYHIYFQLEELVKKEILSGFHDELKRVNKYQKNQIKDLLREIIPILADLERQDLKADITFAQYYINVLNTLNSGQSQVLPIHYQLFITAFHEDFVPKMIDNYKILKATLQDLLIIVDDVDENVVRNGKGMTKKLSLKQAAMLLFYNGTFVEKGNCDKLARDFGHTSGHKLYQEYLKFVRYRITVEEGKRKNENKLKLFEIVVQELVGKAKQDAEKDMMAFKSAFEREH